MTKRGSFASKGYEPSAKRQKMAPVKFVKKVQRVSKYRDPKAKTSETKVNDYFLSAQINYNTAAIPLMGIAQGNDNTNRIGRQIRVKSVHLKIKMSALASTLNAAPFLGGANAIRVAVVNDKSNSTGTNAVYSDVWITSGGNTTQPMMPRNMNNIDRFDVLYDDLVTLNAGGPIGQSVSKYIKLDLRSVYGGTTGVQPFTNGLLLFILDQNDGTGLNYCGAMGVIRLTFFDD